MHLTITHIISLLITTCFVIGCGIYSARSVKSVEGFNLGGRSSSVKLVAGSIAGTSIGGGATIGTAQMAYSFGLSAWWFTLGMGIGFILLAIFYARPLRKSALETIPQYLVLNYGKTAGPVVSLISSSGMFFACVSSVLPGILIISTITNTPPYVAAILLMLLIASYVYFGGMKGAGVSGLLKAILIWFTLFIAGAFAFTDLYAMHNFHTVFAASYWFNLFDGGTEKTLASLFSLIVGVICSQTYIQALFSASDEKTAATGAIVAAAITIPVGLPSVAIAMFMHANQPDTLPMLVLPIYLINYLPPVFSGIALAGILLSIVSSTAGQALAIGTILSKDIIGTLFHVTDNAKLLWTNRATIVLTAIGVSLFSILHLHSQILEWNYLSMALRGGGVFLPLTIAIFKPHYLSPDWAVASMLISTVLALVSNSIIPLPLSPLFIGIITSSSIICIGLIATHHHIFSHNSMLKK